MVYVCVSVHTSEQFGFVYLCLYAIIGKACSHGQIIVSNWLKRLHTEHCSDLNTMSTNVMISVPEAGMES